MKAFVIEDSIGDGQRMKINTKRLETMKEDKELTYRFPRSLWNTGTHFPGLIAGSCRALTFV